jgi:cobalt-zinc-cadmium resistance protein CzcA
VAGLVVWVAGLAMNLGSEFIPRLDEGSVVINTVRLAGVSIEESARYGTQIEKVLLEEFSDEIENIWTRTGTPEVATDPMGMEVSDVFITLKPREQWKKAKTQEGLVMQMSWAMQTLPGMRAIFTQPIEMRVNEMIAGIRTDLGVKIFGDDFDKLVGLAEQVETILKQATGSADVVTEQITGRMTLPAAGFRPKTFYPSSSASAAGTSVKFAKDRCGSAWWPGSDRNTAVIKMPSARF